MFSRFDNMMQHTQTHEKNKKIISSSGEKLMSSNTSANNVHGHHVRGPNQISGMTPIKSEAATTSWIEQQRKQSMPDLVMTTSAVPPLEHSSMINSRTLPLPTRRSSFSGYNDGVVYPQPVLPPPPSSQASSAYRLSYPPSAVGGPSPYYYNYDPSPAYPYYAANAANNIPRNRSSWPVKREPYPQYYSHHHHPTQSAPYYRNGNEDYYNSIRRRSSVSTLSSESSSNYSPTAYQPQPTSQPPQDPQIARRRISIDDLRLPIENLRNIQLDEEKSDHYKPYHQSNYASTNNNDSVDITPDEYEALEGFSKFHSNSVVARDTGKIVINSYFFYHMY
jgi:hypothetical protein